ncbi:MAG: NAD-dependent epimerase/dehydratase family protein [bacterium]|nr:NAD-dependent epimerase/dehydratase family protein [bacterium]
MTDPTPQERPAEMSPARYIEKVSLATGEVLEDDFEPRRLLVHSHRDYHLVDVQARFMMSRIIKATGDENLARKKMKEMRRLGHRTSRALARMIGHRDPKKLARTLFGLKDREYYFRYKRHGFSRDDIESRLAKLKDQAREQLEATRKEGHLNLRVLLTGGTGFVGKEILWQAAHDPEIAEVVVVIRPKVIRDRKTKEIIETLSPAERGRRLLKELWLSESESAGKFRFVAGDVEQPDLGIAAEELDALRTTLTHVIHCAASVAFDDPYEKSFRANVTGTLNALEFSHGLQSAPEGPFVAHVGIETSYIHGRQTKEPALEDEIVFPRNFYNNYYELTKAMASIETERFMLDRGLRVGQLCPAIVIGESRAGNNRGDTKVVNAPVNVFGRARQALSPTSGRWRDRSKAAAIARLACVFPGDPSAQINLIPVDRVVQGIIASLKKAEAVGERVHLATDTRVTSHQIKTIVAEELDVEIKLAEPTIHRTVTLPLLTKVLTRVGQGRTASALEKLGGIFSGYSEWGQPIHEVGKDVEVLGLSPERPSAEHSFRMLCRHNKWVQNFGQLKDSEEISRREKVWWDFVVGLEQRLAKPAGALTGADFRAALESNLDTEAFVLKPADQAGA